MSWLTENLKATKKHVDETLCFMVIARVVYHGPSDQWHQFFDLIIRDVPTTILDPHGLYYEFLRGFDNERYRWKLTSLSPKTSLGVGRTRPSILTGAGDTRIPASISKTTNFLSVLVQTCSSLYKPDKLKSCKGNQLGQFFDKSEFVWVQQATTSSQVSKYDYYCMQNCIIVQ